MSNKEFPTWGRIQQRITFVKVSDFLLLTEPIWVFLAACFVYISIVLHLASFLPWIGLAIALAPFPLRQIRHGYPSRRTPFDIPILLLLAGIIIGLSVSKDFALSLGALQSFLAVAAFYYSVINYPRPAALMKWGLGVAILGLVIASVFALAGSFSPVPHGLGIALVIFAAMAAGIAIFGRRTITRVLSGLLGSAFLGMSVLFTHQSLYYLFTLQTMTGGTGYPGIGRIQLWQETLGLIKGSSIFTGLGLGCWPLLSSRSYGLLGHVHNAYLELYINTGIIGVAALVCAVAIGLKLAIDILRSPREHPYYGFGIGVLLAILATAMVSIVESAPFAFPGMSSEAYYVLSPIPGVLIVLLVTAHRLLRQPAAEAGITTE
jgi:hypothetical protein